MADEIDPKGFGALLRKATDEAVTKAVTERMADTAKAWREVAVEVAREEVRKADLSGARRQAEHEGSMIAQIAGLSASVEELQAGFKALGKALEAFDVAKVSAAYEEHRALESRAASERAMVFAKAREVADKAAQVTAVGDLLTSLVAKADEICEDLAARIYDVAKEAAASVGSPASALTFRGAYDEEADRYEPGEVVVHKGSTWVAQRQTSARPVAQKGGDWALMAGGIGK